MKKDNKRFWKRPDLLFLCLGFGVVFLLCAILMEYAGTPPIATALLGFLLCVGLGCALLAVAAQRQSAETEQIPDGLIDGEMTSAAFKMDVPALMCDEQGLIVWCNRAMAEACGQNVRAGEQLEHITTLSPADLGHTEEKQVLQIGGRDYLCSGTLCRGEEEPFWFLTFTDVTELEEVRARYADERTVVAYIVIDNIEELLQYIQEKFRNAAAEVEGKLKEWAHQMNGVIRAYEKDKYILFFDAANLRECLAGRFAILDQIREIRVGDGMPVTVSIGVCCMNATLAQREEAAQNALDLALQRGGDQAVYKSDEGTEFFGGKTKAVYKRTNIRARVVGNGLCALLGTAGNVLIMGHRFGDFDSFGSAVGVACLVRSRGVPYRIVVNRSDPNIQECFDRMENLPEYADVFVSGTDALDYVKPDTLLILVDVNNYDHVESPALIHAVKNIVIIDHHNQTGEFRKEPLIAYIEPSASSASELVGEILEQHLGSARRLMKEEAEMMLSGILLDTKRFTRSTGTRTFGVALYLRGEGANPAQTNEMFKSDVGELTKESQFLSKVLMYKEHIALAVCDGDMDSSYRVVAAKAADRLLSVKEVHASFALVKIGDRVHISARSDGTVNVQVVLEQLNGGGHFDVAGAQVEDTMHSVVARLKKAIDAFVE